MRLAEDQVEATRFAASSPTLAERLDPRRNALNAIRLLLAALVIVSHSWILGGSYGHTPLVFGYTYGAWSVFAFFVLSGYLVTRSRLSTTFGDYVRRRVLRIYPGFLVCILATAFVFAPIGYLQAHHTLRGFMSTPQTPIDYLLHNFTMHETSSHVAGTPTNPHAWTGTLWSLYFEFVCYLVVGLLASWPGFRRYPSVCAALLLLVTLADIDLTRVQHYARSDDAELFLRLLPYFLAGALLHLLSRTIPCRWWLALSGICLSAGVLALGGHRCVGLCALPMGYLLLYLGAVVPIHLGRRNDLSYGMYMYGYPVEQLLRFLKLSSHTVYTVAAVVLTVPLAAASWFGIERRAMKLGRRSRGRAVTAADESTGEPGAPR
jgi:peptidoglycan/LPS O-acetylase OafA/YrhL